MPSIQTIHDHHIGWDNSVEPAVRVSPGETVVLDVQDASGGQLTADSTATDVAAVDREKANPVTGPIHIEGAEPGHTLSVRIEAVDVARWGWTAIFPDFGLLSEDFGDPYLVHADIGPRHVDWADGFRLPLRPFVGTIGTAPGEPGHHDVIPPRNVGGNLDLRDVRPGSTLHLPVEVEGGLLSLGDTHAAQGDGEVCGTAVEVASTVIVRVDLDTERQISAPELDLRLEDIPERGDVHVTTGVGPDLMTGAKDATRAMIDWLVQRHDLEPALAYCLCSVSGNLRISEIVDAPNWVVSMYLPLDVLG